ncbi:WEB family protein At5g16730, chloroplastic-like [Nicotiana sylvestris]|uniref:WEB family protein At5g16730, chloroplastic-like n=1 Tax=Nicotiana sylvestris TaxID=4096 RepID=UPI00388CBDD8
MAKTSKTVPQKETASSSRPVGDGAMAEPPLEDFVSTKCPTTADFKTPSSLPSARGLRKDVEMRTPSAKEKVFFPPPALKQAKEKKIKRAPSSPSSPGLGKKKPAKRPQTKWNIIYLTIESVQQLRDEAEQEEDSGLASVLHHEAFLLIREERKVEVQGLTEKYDNYKCLSEKLQADLVTTRDEHAEMAKQVFRVLHGSENELEITTNDLVLQLRASREKASVHAKKIEELQSNLANLAKELDVARSEAVATNNKAQVNVTQYKVGVEATLAHTKSMVDHARWQARREALEGARDQSFDISAEIEIARAEETKSRKLSFPEEDSKSLSEFGEENSQGKDASSDKDHAA